MTTSEPADLEARARFVNEHLVDLALELVAAVHDDGPAAVRGVVARVPHGAHDSLAVVLAAMVDPTRTPRELLGWVDVPLSVRSRDVTPVEGRPDVRRTRRDEALWMVG